jgi:uncharacterized SAM-binding protein YcdF (DUF218 family)
VYRFLEQLSQPYTLLCVLALLGVVNLWRKRREHASQGRLLVSVPVLLLVVISLQPFSYLALGTLEWQFPPQDIRPTDAQAIVVLNAGIRFADTVRQDTELEPDSMLRCMHAAKLYRQGRPCAVVVTGGTEHGRGTGPSCAAVMREALLNMGVASEDILLEETSQTTYENVVESCRILKHHGIERIVLVTDATHLMRSLYCFRRQGFDAIPSGCRYGATELKTEPRDLLPQPGAAIDVIRVCHEWVGIAWYWWQGRI